MNTELGAILVGLTFVFIDVAALAVYWPTTNERKARLVEMFQKRAAKEAWQHRWFLERMRNSSAFYSAGFGEARVRLMWPFCLKCGVLFGIVASPLHGAINAGGIYLVLSIVLTEVARDSILNRATKPVLQGAFDRGEFPQELCAPYGIDLGGSRSKRMSGS